MEIQLALKDKSYLESSYWNNFLQHLADLPSDSLVSNIRTKVLLENLLGSKNTNHN